MTTGSWRPIDTFAGSDEERTGDWVLLATSGGHVGQALRDDDCWRWASGRKVHPGLVPVAWQPMPAHPEENAAAADEGETTAVAA
jgi:hypothetical protein